MKIESLGVQSSSRQLTSESGSRVERIEQKTSLDDAVTFERDREKKFADHQHQQKKKKKESEPEVDHIPESEIQVVHIDVVA